MRRGFTLVELIFVIVIIGILAAVAVPKFKNLKYHATVAPVIAVLNDINGSAGASAYLNLTELEGKAPDQIKLIDLFKFTGDKWEITNNDNNATYKSTDEDFNASFYYEDNGTIKIDIDCSGPYINLEGAPCNIHTEINLDSQE